MSSRTVIVLSPGKPEADGSFTDFVGGLYVGAKTRLDAAVNILKNDPNADLILVGGYNFAGEGDIHDSEKVKAMEKHLKSAHPNLKVRQVYSLNCTYHNFVALFSSLNESLDKYAQMDILTNTYHMDRSIKFAKLALRDISPNKIISFKPIPAEQVLGKSIESIIRNGRKEYEAQLAKEKSGLKELETSTYVDNCLGRNFDKLKAIISEKSSSLLTREEQDIVANLLT